MKKYILIIFGGAMLFWASPAEAESYYLYCTIGNKDQGTRNAFLVNMNGESYRLKETKKFNEQNR